MLIHLPQIIPEVSFFITQLPLYVAINIREFHLQFVDGVLMKPFHMPFEVTSLREEFAAAVEAALEHGFLFARGMYGGAVASYVTTLGEAFGAEIARERLFPRVTADMGFEVAKLSETRWAGWIRTCLCSRVSIEASPDDKG